MKRAQGTRIQRIPHQRSRLQDVDFYVESTDLYGPGLRVLLISQMTLSPLNLKGKLIKTN